MRAGKDNALGRGAIPAIMLHMNVTSSQTSPTSVKDQVRTVLDQIPDDCSIDDVQYRLYVASLVSQRMTALEAGAPVVSQDEAERRIEKWLK
jgi:hypothetical protein